MTMIASFRSIAAALIVTLTVVSVAGAQAGRTAVEKDPAQLLDDFVHYAGVANVELASANAQALLESGLTDAELATLLDEGRISLERFEANMSRARLVPELEEIVAEVETRIEAGRLDLARNPSRIKQAVEMLAGVQRQRLLAERRLQGAGEYAVPELVRQIVGGRDQTLRFRAETVLRKIGVEAVSPLAVALERVTDPTARRIFCDILGDLGYPHAAPYLMAVARNEQTDEPVRQAALRAVRRINRAALDTPVPVLFTDLGRQYFDDASSLIAYPLERTNNVWQYDDQIGLTPTPVPTDIFGRVMAMRLTRRALTDEPDNTRALALFVASNLKRENDLPSDRVDPIFGDLQYTPAFYATVFGTSTCMDVLSLALDIQDTRLVRDAIDALSKTTGGSNLFAASGDRQPLLDALRYPDRRVQYEAALTLGSALPEQPFAGDYAVVPMLASAVRTGDRLFAVVIGDAAEDRREIAKSLEDLGFQSVAEGVNATEIRAQIDAAIGADLVVVRMASSERARAAVEGLRQVPKAAVAPVLVLADATDVPQLRMEFRGNNRVDVTRPVLGTEMFRSAIDLLMERAAGGRITEAEAEMYAIEALGALRDIAIAHSAVYDVIDAEPALLAALESRSGGTRMLVADILALMKSERAQRQLFDAALMAEGDEQVELLNRVAASVKRFGNLSQARHLDALRGLVAVASGRTAEAAAQVHGALNLQPVSAVDLLPE